MHLVLRLDDAEIIKAALQEFRSSIEGTTSAIESIHLALRTSPLLKRQRDILLRRLRVKHIHTWNGFIRHCVPSLTTYASIQEHVLESLFMPNRMEDANLVAPDAWPLLYAACLDAYDQCHIVLLHNRKLQRAWDRYSPYLQSVIVKNADYPQPRLCGWVRKEETPIQTVDHITRSIREDTEKISFALIKLRAYFIDQSNQFLEFKGFDIRVESNAAQTAAWYGVRAAVTETMDITRRERQRLVNLDS